MGYIQKIKLISALKKIVASTMLYHGTNTKFDKIKNNSGRWLEFGGIFASLEKDVAESHGKYLYSMVLADSDILTQQGMDYHLDADKIKKILIYEADLDASDDAFDDDLELLWKAVVEEKGSCLSNYSDAERLKKILKEDLSGDAGWKCQAIRGKIAKEFGYKAVEMNDEHGTSYLVLSGTEITEVT